MSNEVRNCGTLAMTNDPSCEMTSRFCEGVDVISPSISNYISEFQILHNASGMVVRKCRINITPVY